MRPAAAVRQRAALDTAVLAVVIGVVELAGGVDVWELLGAAAVAAVGAVGWEWIRVGDALGAWSQPVPVPDRLVLEEVAPWRSRRRAGAMGLGVAVLVAGVAWAGGDGAAAGVAIGSWIGALAALWRVRRAERRLGLRLLEGRDGDGDPVFYRDSPATAAAVPRTLPGIPA